MTFDTVDENETKIRFNGASEMNSPQGGGWRKKRPNENKTKLWRLCSRNSFEIEAGASLFTDPISDGQMHLNVGTYFCCNYGGFKGRYCRWDSIAIEVLRRPKLTGIVRGKAFLHVFAQTSDRLPRLTQTYPIMPDVMDMIESNID
ncbi:hypothetical protein TNCV_4144661 [Trichonephila clavipes]|nr:hypothetical protein TNCV_4144661 [Trichonephila clavipes]